MNWYRIKEWFNWLIILFVIMGLIFWAWQQGRKNEVITIATASKGGYYYEFGQHLKKELERIAGDKYDIELLVTKGSVDNRGRLLKSEVDFGILASGSVSLDNLYLVAPLWKDYSHVVVRNDVDASQLSDFQGQPFILGKPGSGYRAQAIQLMNFFNIEADTLSNNDLYFTALLDNPELQGAIVTTGLLNPDLRKVLATGQYKLMPLSATDGFAFNHIFHAQDAIPAGVYPTFDGPMPQAPLSTISTLAVMAANTKVSDEKVEIMIEALLNSSQLRSSAPVLVDIDPTQHKTLKLLDIHPASLQHYNPNFGLNIFSDALETLAQLKEIILLVLIGLAAGLYKLRDINQSKRMNLTANINRELYDVLEELVQLDRTLKEVSDVRLLRQYQTQVLNYKQRIINLGRQGSGSDIDTSGVYGTAFAQCTDLSNQIALKLSSTSVNLREHQG